MLAYLSWHRPAPSADTDVYEHALEQFHRSLALGAPSGFQGSASFRAAELPWLESAPGGERGDGAGYEDWYLLDDWAALGVLEEAAVSHGHVSAHARVASLTGVATSAVYRLIEGHADLNEKHVAVWVASSGAHEHPSLSALLGDGMDRSIDGLWRRCLGLGPAPEFCLLASHEGAAGVAPSRLPKGWSATTVERKALGRG